MNAIYAALLVAVSAGNDKALHLYELNPKTGVLVQRAKIALPGSPGACKDGWDEILQYQLDIRYRPCNFVELMPRLLEE